MNLRIFHNKEAWSQAVATLWLERLKANPALRMCLPAGNTPTAVYRLMAAAVAEGKISFSRAEIFALDEYGGLPVDDAGRCANALRRSLIDHLDLPAGSFHTLATEADDLTVLCRAYDRAIEPGFDLTLLGIGLNGHLGLNEPGSAPDSTTRRVEMHPSSTQASAAYVQRDQLPTWGVTVGMKQLIESREVWLLACGEAKAGIVTRLVNGPEDVAVPASLLKPHPDCRLFLDQPAASRLAV